MTKSRSKYNEGEAFKNVQELLEWSIAGKAVFYLDRCRNSVWILSQRVYWLHCHLYLFKKAMLKEEYSNDTRKESAK